MKSLTPLIGTWQGSGIADFPTIERTEYLEQLTFQTPDIASIIQYEQKTWTGSVKSDETLLHWEYGFIRPLVDELGIEMMNTQNNGRVEVLKGLITVETDTVQIMLASLFFGNDERMVQSSRLLSFSNQELHYIQKITTNRVPILTQHLEATLSKADGA